jgi:fido (protein-threonine AMPylation protein)
MSTMRASSPRPSIGCRRPDPTDLLQVKEVHEIILGGAPGAGVFRKEEVRIRGSQHRPPSTWQEVMRGMEEWESWSKRNPSVPTVLRSAVLHAWLAHIHPFIDGNGRTARAIGNLELIRAGYPSIILKKTKHRDRYCEALAQSDEGNLAAFFELICVRVHDALRDLERAATPAQAYDRAAALLRVKQENRLAVWNAAVDLLASLLAGELQPRLEPSGGRSAVHRYRDSLTPDDFLDLCEGRAVRDSWSFRVACTAPGLGEVVRLAWMGYRSREMRAALPQGKAGGPSIFWSVRNSQGYPPWKQADPHFSPGGEELTLVGDSWLVLRSGQVKTFAPGQLAVRIAEDLVEALGRTG